MVKIQLLKVLHYSFQYIIHFYTEQRNQGPGRGHVLACWRMTVGKLHADLYTELWSELLRLFGPDTQEFTKYLLIVYSQKGFYIKEYGNLLTH